MGRFHKKRLFGNNYPVTCHFWLGYITKIASEHTPKTTVTIQNCHGYFTKIAIKNSLNLSDVYIKKSVFLFAWIGNFFLEKHQKRNFQMASNGVTIFGLHIVFCCHWAKIERLGGHDWFYYGYTLLAYYANIFLYLNTWKPNQRIVKWAFKYK